MKNRRTSFLNCLLNIISSVFTYIVLAGIMKFNKWAIIFCVVLFIISSVVLLIEWYNKKYRVSDKVFIFQSGIINKRTIRIPTQNIVSVDSLKNIKQRVVRLNNLKINITNESEDLSLVLSNKSSQELLDHLKVNHKTEDEVIYELNGVNTLIFSAYHTTMLSSLSVLLSYGVIFYGIFSDIIFSNVTILFLLTTLFLVSSKIILIIINYFRFKNFKIVNKNGIWVISMGVFNKSSYSLNFDKISAISIVDTLFLRRLNKCTISVSVCGIGNDENNSGIVFPIIDRKEFIEQLNLFFPNFIFDEDIYNISPKHKFRYKTTKYGISSLLMYLEKGIFKKKISIIKKNEIDNISYSQNFINRKRNTYKLKVSYAGMKLDDLKCINGIECNNILL